MFQDFHNKRFLCVAGHAGKSLEISNMVDIRSETNRELVMRLVTDVASGNRFYTDLNGFQVLALPLLVSFNFGLVRQPIRSFLTDS